MKNKLNKIKKMLTPSSGYKAAQAVNFVGLFYSAFTGKAGFFVVFLICHWLIEICHLLSKAVDKERIRVVAEGGVTINHTHTSSKSNDIQK